MATLIAASVLLGYASIRGYVLQASLGLVGIAALGLGLRNWRWSIYGLVVFLPFSGILSILSYPNNGLAVLVKDALFVIPAYLGFLVKMRRGSLSFPGAPVLLIGALAAWVLAQCLNPGVSNYLAALIGVKVWLFYVPLLFLGYHLLGTRKSLQRFLALVCCLALIPAMIGLTEALLIATGQEKFLYGLYGSAAGPSTQNFFGTAYAGGGFLARVPSTFAFAALYFTFAATMFLVAYAWWRLSRRAVLGMLVIGIMLLAAFTSGARAAFIMVPVLLLLVALLDGKGGPVLMVSMLTVSGILAAATIVGADPAEVISHASTTGTQEVQESFLTGMGKAVQLSPLGFGTGTATGAARYVSTDTAPYGAPFSESWWVKIVLELGLPGLLIVVGLLTWITARAFASHWLIRDPGLKGVSAALLGFLIWNFIYSTKGFYVDLEPMNVYFWLFSGILCRLATLDASPLLSNRTEQEKQLALMETAR